MNLVRTHLCPSHTAEYRAQDLEQEKFTTTRTWKLKSLHDLVSQILRYTWTFKLKQIIYHAFSRILVLQASLRGGRASVAVPEPDVGGG